ncbi:MAG: hypothetical protein SPL13_00885 [Clostridia bacterium]|nr:hypothetical protein [Clostridia bacterium]
MQKIFEPIFEIAYLAFAFVAGVYLSFRYPNKKSARIFGIATILLAAGDSFHLIPRMMGLISGDMAAFTFWLGLGKLATSITMTIFYVLLFYFLLERYKLKANRFFEILLFVLATARLVLCAMPQNGWFSENSDYVFGIIRNIPFWLMGIFSIIFSAVACKKDRCLRFTWLFITLSFLFYTGTVVFAHFASWTGMLMLPKTVCYVAIIVSVLIVYDDEKEKRTLYYSDELADDFADKKIAPKDLKKRYPYFIFNPLRKIIAFVLYYFIAYPIGVLYQKIWFGEKIIGKYKLKNYRSEGFFLYGNHTRDIGDAFTPTQIAFPKKSFTVTSSSAVSVAWYRRVVQDLGATPVPNNIKGMKRFYAAIRLHTKRRHVITIYPEAHIWPYYTKIRPFKETAFRYPAEYNKPVFCFTVTYKKRLFLKRPKTVVYIDGPFFADETKSVKTNSRRLRDLCFNAMCERSKNSDCEYITYVKQNESELEVAATKETTEKN